jgi:hypothetical protein
VTPQDLVPGESTHGQRSTLSGIPSHARQPKTIGRDGRAGGSTLALRVQQLSQQLETVQDAVSLSLELMRREQAAEERAQVAEREARELRRQLSDRPTVNTDYRLGYAAGYSAGKRGAAANPDAVRRRMRARAS